MAKKNSIRERAKKNSPEVKKKVKEKINELNNGIIDHRSLTIVQIRNGDMWQSSLKCYGWTNYELIDIFTRFLNDIKSR